MDERRRGKKVSDKQILDTWTELWFQCWNSDNAARLERPASIRDARISLPYSCLGWTACVCVEANAKNSFGGYTGLQQNVAVLW